MSKHHSIALGQCQRQCMASTYFGYKVFMHDIIFIVSINNFINIYCFNEIYL